MATNKKPNAPRMVRVAPVVSDPMMRNSKGPAEVLLDSELGSDADMKDTVFDNKTKTKEEQDSPPVPPPDSNNTMMLIFVLVVVALLAIIVYFFTRQNNEKKEEEEAIKRMIQPHPRNGMPPMNVHNIRDPAQQQQQLAYMEHQRQLAMMQQQQQAMQNQMAQMDRELEPEKPASFAEAIAKVDGKTVPELDLAKEEPKTDAKYSEKQPHPAILRPGSAESDVNDVVNQTNALLKKKSDKSDLNELDRDLLDKIHDSIGEVEEPSDD